MFHSQWQENATRLENVTLYFYFFGMKSRLCVCKIERYNKLVKCYKPTGFLSDTR